MYKILRYFSISSLVSIILAALLLTLFYRHMAIKGIVHLGEKSNVEVAHATLNHIRPQLVDYLASVAQIKKQGVTMRPINAELEKAIQDIMANTAVTRIKIYNRYGIVVFSSKYSQIGESQIEKSSYDQQENPGFISAINGKVASKLVYRDTLNPFDNVTEDDNLIQTYLPVRRTVTAPVRGVFEIYTDVDTLVAYAEYTQIAIAVGSIVILALLYVTLLVIVRRAEKIMAAQQNTIRERTEMLELLSAQLLTAEENEKKHIANELHEGIAQTLSAIKFQVEHTCQIAGQQSAEENAKSLAVVVTAIQQAIQKISSIAMDLRPPSLDDLGVVATIEWYLRKFQSRHAEIRVELEIEIEENEVSRSLKIIVYRIIQEMLENLAKYAMTHQVSISLSKAHDQIILTIVDKGRMYKPGEVIAEKSSEKRIWLYAIEERAVLSGGVVSIGNTSSGGNRIQITWHGEHSTAAVSPAS